MCQRWLHIHGVAYIQNCLTEAEARLNAIEALAQAMSSHSFDEFISLVMQTLNKHIPAERCMLLLVDDTGTRLRVSGTYQPEHSETAPLDYSLPIAVNAGGSGIGVSVQALVTGQPYFWNEARRDPVHIPELARLIDAHETLAVPLAVNGQGVGVLSLTNSRRGRFTKNDSQFLVGISGQVAAMLCECRLREALKKKNAELEKSMAIHQDFISAAVQGEDVVGIATLLSNLLELGVVVQDRALNLLATAAPGGEGVDWGDVVHEMCTSLGRDRIAAVLRQGVYRGSLARIGAGRLPAGQYEFLGAPVMAGKNHLGLLVVVANRELHGLDTVAVKQAAAALALRLTQDQHEFMILERLRGGLLSDITRGDLGTDSVAYERAALLGYELTPPFRGVVIELGRTRDELNARGLATDDAACRRIGQKWPGLMCCRRGKSIVILASGEMARDSSHVVADIVDDVLRSYPGTEAWCGTGDICHSLHDAKASYEQARLAASVGRELGSGHRVFDYNELGFYRLLLRIAQDGQLADYVQRRLGPLIAYDQARASKLVLTLKAFLKNRGSNKKVAKALNIHTNTLQYRLKRIEELCEISLDNQDAVFEIHMALKALPFVTPLVKS